MGIFSQIVLKATLTAALLVGITGSAMALGGSNEADELSECVKALFHSVELRADKKLSAALAKALANVADHRIVSVELTLGHLNNPKGISAADFLKAIDAIRSDFPNSQYAPFAPTFEPRRGVGTLAIRLPKSDLMKLLDKYPIAESATPYTNLFGIWENLTTDIYVADLSKPNAAGNRIYRYAQLRIEKPSPSIKPAQIEPFQIPLIKPYDPQADGDPEEGDGYSPDDFNHLSATGANKQPFKFFLHQLPQLSISNVFGLPVHPYIQHFFLNELTDRNDALLFWLSILQAARPLMPSPAELYSKTDHGQIAEVDLFVSTQIAQKMAMIFMFSQSDSINSFFKVRGLKKDDSDLARKLADYIYLSLQLASEKTRAQFFKN